MNLLPTNFLCQSEKQTIHPSEKSTGFRKGSALRNTLQTFYITV